MRDELGINEEDMRFPDDKKMFAYLEFIVNMLYLCEKIIKMRSDFSTTQIYTFATENIKLILEKLNMYAHIIEEKSKFGFLKKTNCNFCSRNC